MKLIDRRHVGRAMTLISWAPRAPEDEPPVLPPSGLPELVGEPPGWRWAEGLLVSCRLDPTGRFALGEAIPGAPEPAARLEQRRLCVWSLDGGALLHAFDHGTVDAAWTDEGLLDVRWAREEGFTTVTLSSMPPEVRVLCAKDVGPGPHAAAGASAQLLDATPSRTRWLLWSAGHGESGFELLAVEGREVRRLYVTADALLEPQAPALSPDLRWLAFRAGLEVDAEVADVIAMVDLADGRSSMHRLEGGKVDAPEIRFEAGGAELVIEYPAVELQHLSAPRWSGRFPLPLASTLQLTPEE